MSGSCPSKLLESDRDYPVHLGWELDDEHLGLLESLLDGKVVISTGNADFSLGTRILIKGRPTAEELDRLEELELLIIPFAGIPVETKKLLQERPHIAVHNTHHNASSTAEMAIALMLAACKRIPQHDSALREGRWTLETPYPHSSMRDKQVMILGYGAIGSRVARICEAMDMRVSVLKRSASEATDSGLCFLTKDSWREELSLTDILQLCLPATEETRHIIGPEEIARLPDHACLINTGRSSLVHEEALYTALEEGGLGTAGLDVWWNYPKSRTEDACLPGNFPFHTLSNVIMTPHRAGDLGDLSLERRRIEEISKIICCHLEGEFVPNKVDVQRGY